MINQDESKKGLSVVEPGIAVSEFIERINKLSYQNFPVEDVLKVFQKHPLSLEYLDPYIFFSDIRYTRNLLHKEDDFEIILLCWRPGQHSAVHGHENQKCWMRVELGSLEFTNYQKEPINSSLLLKKINTQTGKQGFIDGPAIIHNVANKTTQNAISLHIYANPFDKCDVYDLNTSQIKKIPLGYHSIRGKLVALEK